MWHARLAHHYRHSTGVVAFGRFVQGCSSRSEAHVAGQDLTFTFAVILTRSCFLALAYLCCISTALALISHALISLLLLRSQGNTRVSTATAKLKASAAAKLRASLCVHARGATLPPMTKGVRVTMID